MDPFSMLLSAYITSVSNTVYTHMADTMGTDVEALVINYEDTDIAFQYQMWKVREQSVCEDHRDQLALYSECTVKAKQMFAELCERLSSKQSNDLRYKKTKSMYCNAAISFRPTVAKVAGETPLSDQEQRRAQCNLATAAALGSRDGRLIAQRERACADAGLR